MSSINCFCRIFSLPTICLMKTCWSRSSTFGLSSKSLIRHLPGGRETKSEGWESCFFFYSKHLVMCKHLLFREEWETHSLADEVIKVVRPELWLVESRRRVSVKGKNGKDNQKDKTGIYREQRAEAQGGERWNEILTRDPFVFEEAFRCLRCPPVQLCGTAHTADLTFFKSSQCLPS